MGTAVSISAHNGHLGLGLASERRVYLSTPLGSALVQRNPRVDILLVIGLPNTVEEEADFASESLHIHLEVVVAPVVPVEHLDIGVLV